MAKVESKYDTGHLIKRVFSGEEIEIRYPGVVAHSTNYLARLLFRILSELDLSFISELAYVLLKELLSNASKANAKRIFFKNLGMDIDNPEEYDKTIQEFSTNVLDRWEAFAEENSDSDLYIKILLSLKGDYLKVSVRNNTEIHPKELERIQTRIAFYKKNKNLENAFNEIRDDSEGAGLGIVLTMVLLQNAGIPAENFEITSKNGETISTINIPRSLTPSEIKQKIKDNILREIENLPSLPENIQSIISMCDSEISSMKDISNYIERDPSLAAQVLKLAGSAGYITMLKKLSLFDAVKIVGLKVIRNMLLVVGARNVMNTRYKNKVFHDIWENSNKTAFIVSELGKKIHKSQDIASVAGLLHELGRIVLLSLDPELIKEINRMIDSISGAGSRLKTTGLIEEIAIGIGHPEIGALIATKWKFPEPILYAIRFQQKPLQCPDEYHDLVQILYMSVQINECWKTEEGYDYIEREFLEKFGFDSKIKFEKFIETLKQKYASYNGMNA